MHPRVVPTRGCEERSERVWQGPLAVSIARRNLPGGMSDTHRNLVETGECVVQIISEWYAEAANHSTGAFEYDVDEIQAAGLTTLPTTPKLTSGVPRIAEAAVQMECTLDHLVPIKNAEGQVCRTGCPGV